MKLRNLFIIILAVASAATAWGKSPKIEPSYAWRPIPPLGLHEPATIDTLLYNYYRQAIPSALSDAYATTGNISAPGLNMMIMERKPVSDFFFRDALRGWIPSYDTQRFYNTRIPMTLMSYNFGGGRDNGQDRLKTIFSGNASKEWQVGAMVDYIHSKGSYDYQAAKDLAWGGSASYMGERYEMQAFMYHYNNLAMDNGGITDELYITDPAELQGGTPSINPKSIPVRLTTARSRIRGTQIYVNNRYKVGYWDEQQIDDTTTVRHYVPVSSFIYTLDYNESKYRFNDRTRATADEFWTNTYFDDTATEELTKYFSLRNTLGVSLLEGFHKYAKFGLAAFATYELRKYQLPDYVAPLEPAETLTPLPADYSAVSRRTTQNMLRVGGQLTKQRGSILTYDATAEIGVIGAAAGDVELRGNIGTRIPLRIDTLSVRGHVEFSNMEAPWLMENFLSNHFIWHNDFSKERRLRFGGSVDLPRFGTHLEASTETLQNHIYFGSDACPVQNSGSVQVFSASLHQDLHAGILHWNNRITYQTSSNEAVIPIPKLVIYSNLYLLFRVAKVLHVQFGMDCDYYTRYKAVAYEPSTQSFYNEHRYVVGNYPFCNLYANMKLSKARFYIMWSHFNQGLFGGKNYFTMHNYPLNPRRFQLGISVDFAN